MRFIRNYERERHHRVLQFSVFFLIWAVAFAIFEYFLPLYLESLNLSFIIMGIVLSGSSFISFFIDPFLGYIQRKFPPKTLLIASILMFFANIFLLLHSGNVVFVLFLATNLYGIAFDLFSITSYKSVFQNSVEADRCTNLSFLESLYSVGLLVGAVIAGFAVANGLRSAAYISIGFLGLLLVMILFTKHERVKKKKISMLQGYHDIFHELKTIGRKGIFLIVFMIFIHLFDGFFFVFEPIFAQKFSGYFFNEAVIGGLLLAVYTLPIILFALFFGKFEDRFGRKQFVVAGFLVSSIALLLLQASNSLVLSAVSIFLVSMGFYAIALPAVEGIYESVTQRKFGQSYAGYSVSIMEITLSIGFFFGPLFGGIFLSFSGGFNTAFRIFSALSFVMLVLSMIVLMKHKAPKAHRCPHTWKELNE